MWQTLFSSKWAHIAESENECSRALVSMTEVSESFLTLFLVFLLAILTSSCSNGVTTNSGTDPGTTSTDPATPPTIASIAVTTNNLSINVGATGQFTATATMTDNTRQDVTSTAAWQSLTTFVATMDANTAGLARGVATGSSLIQAIQGGVSGSAPLTVELADGVIGYAYAVNSGYDSVTQSFSQSISQYVINSDGTLAAAGPSAPIDVSLFMGVAPTFIAADPSGHYLYVANGGTLDSNYVSQFTINSDGTLTPMNPAKVATGSNPASLTVDPLSRYLYVTNTGEYVMINENPGAGTWSQYSIGANGALTPMSSPMATTGPPSIAADPAGRYVYVADSGNGTVSRYAISTNGALTPVSTTTLPAGLGPASITTDAAGAHMYVTAEGACDWDFPPFTGGIITIGGNGGCAYLLQYSVGTDGTLTSMNPPVVNGVGYPTIAPSGRYAYVTNAYTGVEEHAINADGTVTQFYAALIATGPGPASIALDPTGKYAYVANSGANYLSQYTINSDGTWTPVNPPTVTAEPGPMFVITTRAH